MSNEMTIALFHSEWGIQNDDYLQHYGILGMHWGIRRYQPYGQGYDADHIGREVGLAARMGGGHGSYSSTYGRGSKIGRLGEAVKSLGRRAGSAANEGLERLNYANERLGAGIKNASKMAKSSLAKYASTDRINGHSIEDDHYRNLLESSGFGTLAKGVGIQLKANARRGINSIKRTSFDDVKTALGSGASRFQEAMSRTAVKSKEFGRNAASAATLLSGVLGGRSSDIIRGRYDASNQSTRYVGANRPGASGGLEDLGAGRNFQTRSGASMRDIIRSVGSNGQSRSNSVLDDVGARYTYFGEKVMPNSKEFKNKRETATGRYSSSPLTYDRDVEHISSKSRPGDLKTARTALLSDLGTKNTPEWGKVLDGKDALEALVSGMHDFNKLTGPNRTRMTSDPYTNLKNQALRKKYGI